MKPGPLAAGGAEGGVQGGFLLVGQPHGALRRARLLGGQGGREGFAQRAADQPVGQGRRGVDAADVTEPRQRNPEGQRVRPRPRGDALGQ
ncbi:hypothetical protein C4609_10740 [Streptococcus agalactiae]|nr:hypothetical protein C4609_10740 [Streptococcus agalactiae]